mgnify:CR=1 FL=1
MKKTQNFPLIILCLLLAFFPAHAQTDADLSVPEGSYLHTQSFTSDTTLVGMQTQHITFFNTGEWEMSEAKLTLEYSSSQLLDADMTASLSIRLNDQSFYLAPIPSTNGERKKLVIDLPVQLLHKNNVNSLLFEAQFRNNDSNPNEDEESLPDNCDDQDFRAAWLNIFKESFVSIVYTPQAPSDTIAQFYSRFTSIDALENGQSAFCLPQSPGTGELTAFAAATTGISGNAVLDYGKIAFCSADNSEEFVSYGFVIYISSYANLQPAVQGALSADQKAQAETQAVAALLHEDGRHILVLTGQDEKALENAGIMLANAEYVQTLETETAPVAAEDNFRMPHAPVEQYTKLALEDSRVEGVFRQSVSYQIDYPENRTIAESSEIDLDFSYAENLDFTKSIVTVYINDVPIGSKKLSRDNAGGDHLLVSIPDEQIIVGDFNIKIAFDFSVPGLWCRLDQAEIPWGKVHDSSMLKIMSVDKSRLVFENYPSPFLRDGRTNNLVVVLPDNPESADLHALNSILLTIGRFQKDNSGSVRVVFASAPGDLSRANIISIGKAGKNNIAQEMGEKIYFRFDPETQGFTSPSEGMRLIDPSYGESIGIAQIAASPFSEFLQGVLIVTGLTDEGLGNAADFLGNSNNLWKVKGDVVVALENEDFISYYYAEDYSSRKPATFTEPVERVTNTGLLIMGASFGLLVLFSALMIYIKYGKRK